MAAVRDALTATDGVKNVQIDFPNRIATAVVNEDVSDDVVLAAVKNVYDDTTLKSN